MKSPPTRSVGTKTSHDLGTEVTRFIDASGQARLLSPLKHHAKIGCLLFKHLSLREYLQCQPA
jgi:hypothetical protein